MLPVIPMRIAYVTSHPIQYQAPLFRRLAGTDGVELRVFFGSDQGLKPYRDVDFNREVRWDIPLTDGFAHEFDRNLSPRPGSEAFFGLVNPMMVPRLLLWKPDVVIVHGYAHWTQQAVMPACRAAGIPVLLRGESNLLASRDAWKRVAKVVGALVLKRLLAGAVAIGTLNRAYYLHYGMPDDRVFWAPYAVDNDFFRARAVAARDEARAWKAALGIAPDATVVGFAAKLSAVKSADTLIEAFGRAAVPKSALVLVGDGPLRGELERKAHSFPGASIHFAGFANQSQMPAAYALADVFVLPSVFEPWGLAINEAMNMGCAIIASDQCGSAPDLVSRDNGWVFEAGNVGALTGILTQALADPPRLRAMGEASRKRIEAWGIPEAAAGLVAAARAVARSRAT